MASKGFLPDSDPALLAWSLNFSTLISAAPIPVGLTAAQATAYAALHALFSTAMAGVGPGVRTSASVAAKNAARNNLKISARLLAKLVEGTATVSNSQKITLGLNVRAVPTPSPIPATAPALEVVSVSGVTAKIRLHDSASGSRRGKPVSVSGASVFSFTGALAPADIGAWKFEGNVGRTRLTLTFPTSLAAGTKVWFAAFWFNGSKQSGPLCAPVGTNLPGGSVSMAA